MTSSAHCYVLGSEVSLVSDLNGQVKNIICPHYLRMTGTCMLRIQETAEESGGGFIASLLLTVAKKLADRNLGTRANYCEFKDVGTR